MGNNGVKIGDGNNFNDINIKNKPKINKTTKISISVGVAIVFIVVIALINFSKPVDITGAWLSDDGNRIEFMSDGTLQEGDYYDDLHADTYEIMDEGCLKWGKYDAGWVAYSYTYWDISLKGKKLTLTKRDNPDYVIELTRE